MSSRMICSRASVRLAWVLSSTACSARPGCLGHGAQHQVVRAERDRRFRQRVAEPERAAGAQHGGLDERACLRASRLGTGPRAGMRHAAPVATSKMQQLTMPVSSLSWLT